MDTLTLRRGRLDLSTGHLSPVDRHPSALLTDTERRLVRYLASRDGAPADREELQAAVWDYRPGVLSRTVFTTVGRVRSKIEVNPSKPDHLVTVPGEGYALRTAGADLVGLRAEVRAPTPATSAPLIGRERELAAVQRTLAEGARLLTLHGPGGVGKTRLALALLHELSHDDTAACFVPLEAEERAEGLARAAAGALGVDLGDGGDPLGELVFALAGRDVLLVLDNVEHLLPGVVPGIEALLSACPGLRIVATSRLRLGLRVEHVLAVPDLELPASGADIELAAAGRMALAAAERVRVGWVPTEAERDELAALCRLVGGSPLGIELAVSWLRVLEPGELIRELGDHATVLSSEERDRPARHRSVAVALNASWRLLGERAAHGLEALGVFAGAFDRRLAEVVAGVELPLLGQLVDASMVRRGPGGFDLHPLLRRSARTRLAADHDREAEVRARHVAALLDRMSEVYRSSRAAPDGARVLAVALHPLRADLVDAWLLAAERGWCDRLLDAGPAMVAFLDGQHDPRAAIAALAGAADRLEARGSAGSDPLVCALRLVVVGSGGAVPHDLDAAAMAAARLPGDLGTLALVHAAIGSHMTGRPAEGTAWARQAIERADERRDDPYNRVFSRGVLGSLLLRLGRLEEAHAVLTEGTLLSASDRGHARTLVHLGQVELAMGRPAVAQDLLSGAIGRLRASGDRTFTVMGLTSLATAAELQGGDPTPLLREAVEEAVRSRLPPAWGSGALARLALRRLVAGYPEEAAVLASQVDVSTLVQPGDAAAWRALTAGLREALDPVTYARQLAEGAALDPSALLDRLG